MAKPTPKQLEEELKKQDKLYGDGEDRLGGSATDPEEDDDMEEAMEDVTGDDFDEEEPKPLNVAEEVDEDEEAIREKPSAEDASLEEKKEE